MDMDNVLSLEATTFMNMFQRLSGNTQVEVFDEMIKRSNLENILQNKHFLNKLRFKIVENLADENVKTLTLNLRELSSFPTMDFYTSSEYCKDMNRHVSRYLKNCKFYCINNEGKYILALSLDDFTTFNELAEYEKLLFDFDVIKCIDSTKLYKIERFDKLRLVEWWTI